MPDILERMSPEKFDLYKRLLLLRTKSMRPETTQATFSRLGNIIPPPTYSPRKGRGQGLPAPEPEPDVPLWQRGLGITEAFVKETPFHPQYWKTPEERGELQQLQYLEDYARLMGIEDPRAWAEKTYAIPRAEEVGIGAYQPEQAGMRLPPLPSPGVGQEFTPGERAVGEWGLPGAILAGLPTATALWRGAATLPKALQIPAKVTLAPLYGVEQALPVTLRAIGAVGERLFAPPKPIPIGGGIAPKVSGLVPDLTEFKTIVNVASRPDFMRKIAGVPQLRPLAQIIGGRAGVARKPVDWAIVGREMLRHEGSTKTLATMATVNKMGSSVKVFGLDAEGRIAAGALRGTPLNTIRTYPQRYLTKLTKPQREWVGQTQKIEEAKLVFLKRNKIPIRELAYDEGGTYAGRRVLGKVSTEGELLDYAYLGGPRFQAKAPFERTRVFKDMDDALKEGFRYIPEEDALALNVRAAYNRVADQQMSNWLVKQIPHRLLAGKPKTFAEAALFPGFRVTVKGKPRTVVFTGPEAKETMRTLRGALNPQFSQALNQINKANAVGRYFALAGDASPFLIQLQIMASAHPKTFGKAIGGFVRALFDPKFLDNFYARHITTIQNSPGLVLARGGGTEFTEAAARGGWLRAEAFRIPGEPIIKTVAKAPIRAGVKVLQPFMRGFEAALDVAGIYLKEGYQYLATTPARNAQVDALVNELRGLMSTARIGVPVAQRQLETFAVLAPKYNRAFATFMADVARGNLRGQLARDNLIKGMTGMAAMTVAVSLAMGEDFDEIVEHLNPTSPKFMTWTIAGQNIGPGGKMRSVLKVIAQSADNPENLLKLSMENPNLRFIRANLAPVIRTGLDLWTGQDYIGDPTREGLLDVTRTVLGRNLLPIWVQSVVLEGKAGEPPVGVVARGAAEFMGMRGYPQSPSQIRDTARDRIAQERYGMTWEELGQKEGRLAQIRLEQEIPELQELAEKAEESYAKIARGEGKVWVKYNQLGQAIEQSFQDDINLAAKKYEADRDGRAFRLKTDEIANERRIRYEDRRGNLDFTPIFEYFDKPLEPDVLKEMHPYDIARREYYKIMFTDDIYDQYGEYRFDEAERRRQQFIRQYGQEALNYVEEFTGIKWTGEEPKIYQQLKQAREILAPYWQVEERIWSQYPSQAKKIAEKIAILERTNPDLAKQLLKRVPTVLYARKLIADLRSQFKTMRPDVQYYLNLFYSY